MQAQSVTNDTMAISKRIERNKGGGRFGKPSGRLPGMLRLAIRELCLREGIENPYSLSQLSGLPYATCRRIWNETATRVDLSTLEALCVILECRPGMLFDYRPEPERVKRRSKKTKRTE